MIVTLQLRRSSLLSHGVARHAARCTSACRACRSSMSIREKWSLQNREGEVSLSRPVTKKKGVAGEAVEVSAVKTRHSSGGSSRIAADRRAWRSTRSPSLFSSCSCSPLSTPLASSSRRGNVRLCAVLPGPPRRPPSQRACVLWDPLATCTTARVSATFARSGSTKMWVRQLALWSVRRTTHAQRRIRQVLWR